MVTSTTLKYIHASFFGGANRDKVCMCPFIKVSVSTL